MKGGLEEAGTEWLLLTLVFMMFSTIFCLDLPWGSVGGLLTVLSGILQHKLDCSVPRRVYRPADRFAGLHTVYSTVAV